MEQVSKQLDKAAEMFKIHNFQKALDLYSECAQECRKANRPKQMLYNVLSSKGALEGVMGDYDLALKTLEEVLSNDPYHHLCLVRRSQIYKKKNKPKKALKDLQKVTLYSPDNLQIAALKIQIQNMLLKNQNNSSSESSSSSDGEDEESQLKFFNLRKIDRTSVSIMLPNRERKSFVTILGDTAVEYERPEWDKEEHSPASTALSKKDALEKYISAQKQIQIDDDEEEDNNTSSAVITVKTPAKGRSKSILKNRECSIFYATADQKPNIMKRDSRIVERLNNIDGKVIKASQENIDSEKEVGFRKSLFVSKSQPPIELDLNTGKKSKGARKSCLKRSSFDIKTELKPQPQIRRSKFEMMAQSKVDGAIVKRDRKSIDYDQVKENVISDSDSEECSSHNIFGSKQFVLSKEIHKNLGIEGSNNTESNDGGGEKKMRSAGGKSILKKASVMHPKAKTSELTTQQTEAKRPKKSVMFTKTT